MSLIFPVNINDGIYAHHMKTNTEKMLDGFLYENNNQASMTAYFEQKWETGYDAIAPADRALFWIDGLIESGKPITEKMVVVPGCPAGTPQQIIFQNNYDQGCSTCIGLEFEMTPKIERFNRFFCLVSARTPSFIFKSKIQQNHPGLFKGLEDFNFAVVKIIDEKQKLVLVEIEGRSINDLRYALNPLAPPTPPEPVLIPMDITIGD